MHHRCIEKSCFYDTWTLCTNFLKTEGLRSVSEVNKRWAGTYVYVPTRGLKELINGEAFFADSQCQGLCVWIIIINQSHTFGCIIMVC